MNKKVLVIGGGAAGMFAAVLCARQGADVTILEKNAALGKKLAITGKGRCNLTNNCDRETLLAHVMQNPRFLYSAFSQFSTQDTMRFFESLGVALKTERGARVFPVSDQAQEIIEALKRELKRLSVKIIHGTAKSILAKDGVAYGVLTDQGELLADAILLATGGLSYPITGSTGDGYRMAEEIGHTVVPTGASLVPLIAEPKTCGTLQGLSLKNVSLRLISPQGKCLYEELGEMLFTHFGVSGPLVLSASAHMRDPAASAYRLTINLKPGLSAEKLEARMLRDFEERKNQNMLNALRGLLPAKLIPVVLEKADILQEQKVHSLDKKMRARLLKTFQEFPLVIDGKRSVSEAVITSGGIRVSEIDPKTMQSKRVRRLYFAGEIIDVDAYTGGFNLQIAWSTAYAAGIAMAQKEGIEDERK